jgi:hypothetical protein
MSSNSYFDLILPFARQSTDPFNPPASKWKLDAFRIARSILRLLDNPDGICQSDFGCCGPASFLRAWAYRNPDAIVPFATQLYTKGTTKLDANASGDDVKANGDLLSNPYMKNNPHNAMGEAFWMIAGSLSNTNGLPMTQQGALDQLTNITLPGTLIDWLNKTHIYDKIEENVSIDQTKTFEEAKDLAPDNQTDVFFFLNCNMMEKGTVNPTVSVPHSGDILNWFPNHWLMLTEKMTLTGNIIKMKFWSWGGYHEMTLTVDSFNDDFFGYVKATANSKYPKRTISPMPLYNDTFPDGGKIHYTLANTLDFEWFSNKSNVEWFEILREEPTHVDVLKRVWVQSSGKYQAPNPYYKVSMPLQDPNDPYGATYKIAACNSTLKPYPSDPYSGDSVDATDPNIDHDCTTYNYVQCNSLAPYAYSYSTKPITITETDHFKFVFYAYPNSQQIPCGIDPLTGQSTCARTDKTVSLPNGKIIGNAYKDGSINIITDKTTSIKNEKNTPEYIQKIQILLEYLHSTFTSSPLNLKDPGASQKISVYIQNYGTCTISPQTNIASFTLNSNLSDSEIFDKCFGALINITRQRYIQISKLVSSTAPYAWTATMETLIKDYLLSTQTSQTMLSNYILNTQRSLDSPDGTAAIWLYACTQYQAKENNSKDPQGLGFINDFYTRSQNIDPTQTLDFKTFLNTVSKGGFSDFVYSTTKMDLYTDETFYGNLILATAGKVVSTLANDNRYTFLTPSSAKPTYTQHTLSTSTNPLKITGKLAVPYAINYQLVTLDQSVNFLKLDLNVTGAKSWLLQLVLLDSNDKLVDIIKSDKTQFSRGIGLRGGKIRKLLLCEAATDTAATYNLTLTSSGPACDLLITKWNRADAQEATINPLSGWTWDTPDIYLTSEDNSTPIDVINIQKNVNSIIHFEVHNHGNLAADNTTISFYYLAGNPLPDKGWIPLQIVDKPTGENKVVLPTIPTNSKVQGTLKWFCPFRDQLVFEKAQTVSFLAEINSIADTSPDNNRAIKNHAVTNAKVANPPSFKIEWPTATIDKKWLWGIDVIINKENTLGRIVERTQNPVTIEKPYIAMKTMATAKQKTATVAFNVSTQKALPTIKPVLSRTVTKSKAAAIGTLQVTFNATSKGRVVGGFTVPLSAEQTK